MNIFGVIRWISEFIEWLRLTPAQREWLSFYDTLSAEDLRNLRGYARELAQKKRSDK